MPVNMTAQWVERIRETELDRRDHFDSKVVGLGLRVSRTGKRIWFVQYRVKGDTKRRRLTLDPYPQMSLGDAREKAQAALLDAAKGADPGMEKQEEKGAATFEALALEYLEKYAKAKRSYREEARTLHKDLLPVWGKRKAHEIKRRDVIALLDAIKERGAPIQANRTLALVRQIYNWGISRDLVDANPCNQVKRAAPENQRDRVLSEDEIRSVWKAFGEQEQLIATMLKLRLLTAQRGGEIETMRWSDVEMKTAWWTIPAEYAKNGLSHRVPLSPPALALLQELRPRTGDQVWVFPSPKRRGQPILNIQKAAQRVQEASGVEFVMHDLRRTAASLMTGMGISRLVVSKILNHVEQGVTRIYDRHSYDKEKREALDAWAEKLESILSEES